jgi:hypothetical protein
MAKEKKVDRDALEQSKKDKVKALKTNEVILKGKNEDRNTNRPKR